MLRWIRIAISAGALLTIASEAGAAEMGNPYSGGVEQRASDGFTPSLNSAGQKTSNLGSPSQSAGPVRDPGVARAADKLAAATTPGNAAYKIGPLDVLDISVFQAPDLSKTVEVASNGTIDLPLLGETPAAGKSVYELQRELNSKFGAKYLQNPQVTVSEGPAACWCWCWRGCPTLTMERRRWERQMDPTNKRDQLTLVSLIGAEREAEFDVSWIEHELEVSNIERVGAEL